MPAPGPTITDILTAASQPSGDHHVRSVLGTAPDWLTDRALAHGLDIAGFVHTVDTSAIRHIIARHSNAKVEKSRGQLPLTKADLERIPDVLANPDQLVFGAKNPRHQPIIGYIKRLPDGTILYLEELRTGRKELAAVSMRKHPATALSGSIAATLEPNGRTDGGDTIYIVDFPQNVTVNESVAPRKHPATIDANATHGTSDPNGQTDGGAAQSLPDPAPTVTHPVIARREAPKQSIYKQTYLHRLAQILPPALGLLVLIAVIFGLHGALSKIGPRDVLAALAATSAAQLTHAAGLLALSFLIMLAYDVPGILFAAKLPAFPRLAARRIGFASFCAYALSHVLGAPALSAAAIRVRLYAQWGAPPAGIARIIALSGTSFALGATTLFGLLLLCRPADLPLPGNSLSTLALRAIGAALCAAILAYAFIAQARPSLTLFGRSLPLPGRALACAQIILSSADIAIASAILYVVLPSAPGLTPAHVLAIYLAAFAAGLVSSLPAGVGVFDTLLLLGLAPYMPAADAIGAILLFRVLYYLAPATAAGLAFAVHEVLLTAKKR